MPGMALETLLMSTAVRAVLIGALLNLGGCAALSPATDAAGWLRHLQAPAPLPEVLLLGEQHDAPEHQAWESDTVRTLAQKQRLAAVRAGVPVHGGNLRRKHMAAVMQKAHWDQHLPPTAWERQRDAIRSGHCDLLPASQIAPMARIQLDKDASIAAVAQAQMQSGKTVLVIAGSGHVLRSMGIPTWLPAHVTSGVAVAQAAGAESSRTSDRDWLVHTPDHCAPSGKTGPRA